MILPRLGCSNDRMCHLARGLFVLCTSAIMTLCIHNPANRPTTRSFTALTQPAVSCHNFCFFVFWDVRWPLGCVLGVFFDARDAYILVCSHYSQSAIVTNFSYCLTLPTSFCILGAQVNHVCLNAAKFAALTVGLSVTHTCFDPTTFMKTSKC